MFLFFSTDVPPLLYYSHLPALIVSLLIGIFVFIKSRNSLEGKLLLAMSLVFSVWTLVNLITWTNNNSDIIFFAWSFFGILFTLLSIFCFYLFVVYISKKDLTFQQKVVICLTLLPIVIFTPTNFNLFEFNLSVCGIWEGGPFFNFYYYTTGLVALLGIVVFGAKIYKKSEPQIRKQILLLGSGISLFLFSLFNASFIADWLVTKGIVSDFGLEQYGLFGMLIFMAFLTYMIVTFKAFDIKLVGAQALVTALVIVVGSQFFFLLKGSLTMTLALVAFTLVLVALIGLILVRSVKKEVSFREQLEVANEGQSNLVHFITHQVKGYFTKSRNVFNELLTEPDYGPISESAKHMAEEGFKSLTEGVEMVQQVLRASSIEKGTMQYALVPLDFSALVRENVDALRPAADAKGVTLTVEVAAADAKIVGDAPQLKEVVRNLVDNAIRYTPQGTVTVSLTSTATTLGLAVTDSGIGISPEDKARLFTKGGRGKESLKVNVNSTGYGLFIVKQIVEQGHHGKVWAESAGAGTGSTFIVELPLAHS